MGFLTFLIGFVVLVSGLTTGLSLWYAGSVGTGGAFGIMIGVGLVGLGLVAWGLSIGKSKPAPAPQPQPAAAPPPPPPPTPQPAADLCPKCGRRMLPGQPCPFCNPPVPAPAPAPVAAVDPGYAAKGRGAVEGPNGYLQVVEGPDAGKQLVIAPRMEITIGRNPDNMLVLSDQEVSGYHCRLICGNDRVRFEDLGSSNGSFLNEQPITEGLIKSGDTLRLGRYTKIFFSYK
ncbi:MAG: FHA domain-containing protein [Planctomycetota bacterium]|nr:MAG: FHA domain-containing protein [Planctomycetota bacterium]